MTRRPRTHGPPPASWLRGLAAALLVFNLALAAYVLWRSAMLTPYYDQIDWIDRWRRFQVHGDWAAYLLEPVNLHRLPMIFGLLDFDIRALRGTNWPLILSGAAALAAMAAVLARETARAAPPPLALPAASLAVILSLMGSNVLDAATPICVNYIHGAALAVVAIVLAEGGERSGLSGRRLAALAAAVLAGFGDAAAVAVWPVLALGALRRREGPWLAAVTVAGAAFLGFYAWGQGGAAQGSTAAAFQDPLSAVRLTLNFLPLPWTRANVQLAWIPGLIIAVVASAAVVLRGGRHAARNERVAACLILFSLGVAAMAGLGRTTGDPLNVPLRYGVLLAPLHAGILMLALPYAGELWRSHRGVAQALCAGVLLVATSQNLFMAEAAIRTSDKVRGIVADFRAGQRTADMPVFVHPSLPWAEQAYDRLERDGLYQRELHLKPRPAAR